MFGEDEWFNSVTASYRACGVRVVDKVLIDEASKVVVLCAYPAVTVQTVQLLRNH